MATSSAIVTIIVFTILSPFLGEAIQIAISHCNDISGQIETFKNTTNVNNNKAPEECEREQQYCIGGLLNLVHWLHQKNETDIYFKDFPDSNIFRFVSGNMIGGDTGWMSTAYGYGGWSVLGKLMEAHIQPSASSLGMNDFGAGVRKTIEYLNHTGPENFTLGNTCQTKYTEEDEMDFCSLVNNSIKTIHIKNDEGIQNHAIGVIGFIMPAVERLSLPGKLKFLDVPSTIKQLTEKSDLKTIIAIGDGDLEISKKIMDLSPKVKLVIYGSAFSSTENMTAEYPLPYKHGFIATAGRYGYSVGKMIIDIDKNTGDITIQKSKLAITRRPKILNAEARNVTQNNFLKNWKTDVQSARRNIIGSTRVNLQGGETCWRGECNLGNLMTDAAVHCVLKHFSNPFPHPLHSIWYGGAFFDDLVRGGGENLTGVGNISRFDVNKWLPYHNNVHLVKVKGEKLIQLFNKSESAISSNNIDGKHFLQVSNGLQIHYDTQKVPTGIRIRITQDYSGVPRLADVEKNKWYYFAIPTFLYEGRGVYQFASDIWTDVIHEDMETSVVGFDSDCLAGYINAMNQVTVGMEKRIRIDNDCGLTTNSLTDSGPVVAVTFSVIVVSLAILLVII